MIGIFFMKEEKRASIAHFQHIPLNVTFKLVQTVIGKHIERSNFY